MHDLSKTTRRAAACRHLLTALLIAASAVWISCDSSPTEPCTGPMNVGGNVTRPVKLSAPQPQYTEEARRARVQGVVIVQAIIDCDGFVASTTVLKGLPMGLSEAAVDAIRQWRFQPARQDGRAVMVYYNLTVNFRLQ